MRVTSIHLPPMEVSNKERVFYLHGALGAGKRLGGGGLEFKRRVVMTCKVAAKTIFAVGK